MLKSIGSGIVNLVVSVMSGFVAVGDRVIHAGSAIVANEFFLMALTIAGFVLLMRVK